MEYAYWKYLKDNLLCSYTLYNQKQFIGYTGIGNKEVLKKLGVDTLNEISPDDSLTYVGLDDEK